MAGSEGERAATAIEYAIALVAARSWPQSKLREKIAARYDAGQADEAIARMRELRMVDDDAWAERFARERFERSGRGRHRIRAELLQRGIDAVTADEALARVLNGEAEREKAAAVLASMRVRLGRGEADSETAMDSPSTAAAASRRRAAQRLKNRLFRRMLARGYPAALVRDLLDVS